MATNSSDIIIKWVPCLIVIATATTLKLVTVKDSFTLSCGKGNIFLLRMGNIGLYGAIHMETCSKGNSKGVIINWVLCRIVTATAMTKFPLPLPQLSVNEPLKVFSHWLRQWQWKLKYICFPSRMGYIGAYGSVHTETCSKGNGNW